MAQAQQHGGLDVPDITNVARIHWNLSVPALYRGSGPAARGADRGGRPARLPHRSAHRPFPERQVHRPRAVQPGPDRVGQGQSSDRRRAVRRAVTADCSSYARRTRAVRPGLLRRRRSRVPPAGPRHHRAGVAQPVRAQPVHRRSGRGRRAGAHAGVHRHRHRRASRPIRRATARDRTCSSLLNFAKQAGAHRRHELRRRDQEVGLHA